MKSVSKSVDEIRARIADGVFPVCKLEQAIAKYDRSPRTARTSYGVSTWELDDSENHQCNPAPMPLAWTLKYLRRECDGDEAWFQSVAHEPIRCRLTFGSLLVGRLLAKGLLGHRDDEADFRAEVAEAARMEQEQNRAELRARLVAAGGRPL